MEQTTDLLGDLARSFGIDLPPDPQPVMAWHCGDCAAEHPAPLAGDGCSDCGSTSLTLVTL